MKARILVTLGFLLAVSPAFAQTVDSSVHVNQFKGATVGAKVANAMLTCTMAPAAPCILVLDPSLAPMTIGTIPSLCTNCFLSDWRNGPPLPAGGVGTHVGFNNDFPVPGIHTTGFNPQACFDLTGNSEAQSCSTPDPFTLAPGNTIIYTASVENSTNSLTLTVNGHGPFPIAIPGDSNWNGTAGGRGWTTTLPLYWFPTTPVMLVWDGADWDTTGTGIVPGGYTPGFELTTDVSALGIVMAGGQVNCNGVATTVAGLTPTILAADSTNYIYLNPAANCAIGINTTGFGSNIPLYQIATNLGIIAPILDLRSMYTIGVGLTAPPYAADLVAQCHAKCDGSTDDHAAIQACLDNNPAIKIPPSTGGVTECMTGTVGFTMCSSANKFGYNAIYGQGQMLGYTGSGVMGTISNACDPTNSLGMNRIEDLYIDAHAATGTPTMIKSVNSWHLALDNVDDEIYTTLSPSSYTSVDINNSTSGGAEAITVSRYLGSGALTIEGSTGGTGALTVGDSEFGSIQATNLNSASIDAVLFSDGSTTSTIYDSPSLSISASGFSAPVIVGSIDGGISSIIANNDTFFSTLTATAPTAEGPTVFYGSAEIFLQTTLPAMAGTYVGHIEGVYDDVPPGPALQFDERDGLELSPFYYSVAGTPLPTCNTALSGTQLQVRDATSPTFLGTYTGSGAVKIPVLCNGTNWVTY